MKKVLAAIGGFFKKIWSGVISGADPTIVQLPADLKITPAEIDECIKAVNIIKGIVNNPVTVLVTDLTPISMDNEIRLAISNALPGVLAGLTFSKTLITGVTDTADQVNTLLANVRLSDDADKNALYHALAARFIMIASKGKVSWSDAVSILEIYLKQVFGNNQTATDAANIAQAVAWPNVAPVVAAIAPVVDVTPASAPAPAPVALPALTPEQIAAVVAQNAAAAVQSTQTVTN